MMRNLIVLGCASLLALGLSLGSFAGSSPDADSDGVPDSYDNCVNSPNGPLGSGSSACTAQQDSQTNGYGSVCDSDLNGNGTTDLADVSAVLLAVGSANAAADLNCNGTVDLADVSSALLAVGSPPGPSGLACAAPAATGCVAQ